MKTPRRAIFGLLIGVLASAVLPSTPATAADTTDFADLAHRVPGFRLVVNRPLVPDVPFFTGEYERRRLTDFTGQVVLVTFWATWCKPCSRSMSELDALQRTLEGEAFAVVPIAAGQQMGKTPEVFFAEKQLHSLPIYRDPHARLLNAFETRRVPASFLIDRDGRVVGGVLGATTWNTPEAVALVRALMH